MVQQFQRSQKQRAVSARTALGALIEQTFGIEFAQYRTLRFAAGGPAPKALCLRYRIPCPIAAWIAGRIVSARGSCPRAPPCLASTCRNFPRARFDHSRQVRSH